MAAALQFKNLSALAAFSKKLQPKGYTINTLNLTLSAKLSELETAIAFEQYEASFYNLEPRVIPFNI